MLHKCRADSTRRRLAPPTTPNQMIWLETLKVVGTRIINLYAVLQRYSEPWKARTLSLSGCYVFTYFTIIKIKLFIELLLILFKRHYRKSNFKPGSYNFVCT